MNAHIGCLIVDDERNNRSILKSLLHKHLPEVTEIFEATTVAEALELLTRYEPQILLLDIQLQNESGFELLQQMPYRHFQVIFVTAHDEYALKALKFEATDYLMKPIITEELKLAIHKAIKKLNGPIETAVAFKANDSITLHNITISSPEGFYVVAIHDIIYGEARSNYTIIHLSGNKKITSSHTLGYYHDILIDQNFFRPHRSYLINLAQVTAFKKSEGGFIVMSNGHELELSRNNKTAFLNLFKG